MRKPVVRVGLLCGVLPEYRLAVYEQLAKRPEFDLTVLYSKEPPYYSLKTVPPNGRFKSELIEMKAWRLGNQEFLYYPVARRLVSSGRFDVVVLPANPRLLSNLPSLYAAKGNRTGVVSWSIGLMPNQSRITLLVRKLLMRIPDAVLLYTEYERDYFVAAGIPEEKLFVAQNTIDISQCLQEAAKWSPGCLEGFAEENRLSGKRIILYCARLTYWKRLDLLIRSVAELLDSDPTYHLVIIGRGEAEMEFRKLVVQLAIAERVLWLGAMYEQSDLAPWFLSARVLVIPEVLGLTVFHSFAYGLPVITCDSYDHQAPESVAVQHETNGLLYRQGDVADLGRCITRICNDDNLRSALCMNARATVLRDYTLERMIEGFSQAIRYAEEKSRNCKL